MKKWKQLITFVMILTMVMGMTSFAQTRDIGGSTTAITEIPSLSTNTYISDPQKEPKLSTTDEETKKLVEIIGLNLSPSNEFYWSYSDSEKEALAEKLDKLLKTENFGKSTENPETSSAVLSAFNIYCGQNTQRLYKSGKYVLITLDCSNMELPDTITKKNLRLLQYKWGEGFSTLPIISYESNKLVTIFTPTSYTFCLAYSETPADCEQSKEWSHVNSTNDLGDLIIKADDIYIPTLETNTIISAPNKAPVLSTTDEETGKLVQKLGLTYTFLPRKSCEPYLNKDLVYWLEDRFVYEDFGKIQENSNASFADLYLFNVKATKNCEEKSRFLKVELDCSNMNLSAGTTKANFRLFIAEDTESWDHRPTIEYKDGKLVIIVYIYDNEETTYCLAYSKIPGTTDETDDFIEDELEYVTKADDIIDKTTNGNDAKPTPTPDDTSTTPTPTPGQAPDSDSSKPSEPTPSEPTPSVTPEPTDPKVTSDAWKLTYDSMIPNKYNVLTLRWNQPSSITGKTELWYSATPEKQDSFKRLTSTKKTSYTFKKMEIGVRYGFQLRSKNDPSKVSEVLYVTRPVTEVTKTTVTATVKSYNSVIVKWEKVPGVKKYVIYRNGKPYAIKSGTKFTDKGLTPGETYHYSVAPVKMANMKNNIPESQWEMMLSAEDTATPTLKPLAGLKVTASSSDTLKISWKKVKGAAYYTVQEVVLVNGAETLQPIAGYDQPLNKTQLKLSGLAANSEHTYVVTAYAGKDHTSPMRKAGRTKIAK